MPKSHHTRNGKVRVHSKRTIPNKQNLHKSHHTVIYTKGGHRNE